MQGAGPGPALAEGAGAGAGARGSGACLCPDGGWVVGQARSLALTPASPRARLLSPGEGGPAPALP